MHHYRCQDIYISSTANERIVDTLKFFPHNYQMSQISSNDRLIMAATDMTDALQNPHPEVPFTQIGDDTISAIAELAAIFKLKLQQTPAATLPAAPLKVLQRPCLAESSNSLLASTMTNEITDSNSHTRHNQRAITSEGGHTQNARHITYTGLLSLSHNLSPQLVPTRLLRHGHCTHGHLPGLPPLVSAAPSRRRHPPHHGERDGIHVTHEGSPSPAPLETRL
jgi:hypothetical protein